MKPQLAALELGVHVVVGTPGRALDHITRGSLDLTAWRPWSSTRPTACWTWDLARRWRRS